MSKMTLQEFYRTEFNSDPQLLLEHPEAYNEISLLAEQAYVDWSSICNSVKPSRGDEKYKGRVGVTNKKYKGRVAAYIALRDSNDRTFEYPTVNFALKGGDGGGRWSGFDLLLRLYEQHKGQYSQEQRLALKKKNQDLKAKIDKRNAHKQKQNEKSERLKIQLNQQYSDLFDGSEQEPGDQPYLAEKGIGDIAKHCVIKRCVEFDKKYSFGHYGQEFLALRYHDIDGNYAFIQRIFADGDKLNSPNADFSNGAHMVIGDIETADIIFGGEGFATCASAFLAMLSHKKQVAVIVGINSGNLKKVLALYKQKHPEKKITALIDNDQPKNLEGKGNAGMLVGCFAVDELGYKAVFPSFHDYPSSHLPIGDQPTDYNDLHKLAGLGEVKRQLLSVDNRFQPSGKTPFEQALRKLNYLPVGDKNKALHKNLNDAARLGSALWPVHFDRNTIIQMMYQNLAHLHGNDQINLNEIFQKVIARLDWLIQKHITDAQAFRSFSYDAIIDPLINYTRFSDTYITDEIYQHVQALLGITIVRAPMAAGKTQRLMSKLMLNAKKAAYFAHRVSLIASSVRALNAPRKPDWISEVPDPKIQGPVRKSNWVNVIPDTNIQGPVRKPNWSQDDLVQNYQEYKGKGSGILARNVDQMGLCINSITNPVFTPLLQNLDCLLIDEAAQTLRHVADGSAVEQPESVYHKLIETIRSTTGQVILCDADANDDLIELCKQARPGEVINIVELNTNFSDIKIKYTDNSDQVFNAVFNAVRDDEKVLVANDSANSGKAMYQSLKQQFPEKKFLFVYQDSKGDEIVNAFNENPDETTLDQKFDAVIYSPCISSGVSLEAGYYTKNFAILCGTVSPSDAVQMIRRDRVAREFIIGFTKSNNKLPEHKNEILRGMVLADACLTDMALEDGMITFSRQYTQFDDMRVNIISKQNKARNDFANNMLRILAGDKYKIERIAANDIDKGVGKELRQMGRDIALEQNIELQLSVETPSDEEADRYRHEDCLSERERAELKRHDIENQLCHPVNEETISFNENHGISKVQRFELLKANIEQTLAFDEAELKAGIGFTSRKRKTEAFKLLNKLVTGLGINLDNGEGEFSPGQMRDIQREILSDEQSIELYNFTRIGSYVSPKQRKQKCATAFVKNILAKAGLEIESKLIGANRKRAWSIDPSSWRQMMSYYQARQNAEISSLKPVDITDEGGVMRSGLSINIRSIIGSDHPINGRQNTLTNCFKTLYGRLSKAMSGLGLPFGVALSSLSDDEIHEILSGEFSETYLRAHFADLATNLAPIPDEFEYEIANY